MSYVNIPSYEGSQPFIYVYYAEDDTRLALPVLARLYNEGMRMWSWNGCANPDDVRAAQRISSCAALLIFLSDNLNRDIDREYFEAMEALRCNKVKYFVRLSDVELPFDWGKSDTNVIIDYARSNEAAFWLSIYDSDILERCRGSWPKKPIKAGLSAFDAVDSSELSDEYSSILKIIGESPALDRSGVPINAEDIALFAGASDESENESRETQETPDYIDDDINKKSMQDLFGMLDEISVSTRRRAEELQQSAEKRRQEQEKAAMSTATLPFQQDITPVAHSDEPPVPALSFTVFARSVEFAASEMFGEGAVSELTDVEIIEPIMEDIPIVDISEINKEQDIETPSFEDFIDELTQTVHTEETAVIKETEIEETAEEEAVTEEELTEEAEEAFYLPLSSQAKTVEIEEEPKTSLLPPANGSLTGYTLPDDKYIPTVYLENEDERPYAPTAAERAAAAEQSRKQFESAIENAAFKVTGRIVARHSKGTHSVGLKVKKRAKKVTPTASVKVKSAKAAPTPPAVQQSIPEQPLSRVERRRSRRKSTSSEETETQEARRISVVPDPVRVVPPAVPTVSAPPVAPPVPAAPPAAPAPEPAPAAVPEGEESAKNARKKRHPHNSSGLMEALRSFRSQQNTNSATEETE